MKHRNTKNIIALSVTLLVFVPVILFAQEGLVYKTSITLPGFSTTDNLTLSDLINTLYFISISLAGILAVIKIIIAGLKYALSDVVTNKSDAIRDIRGALIGLIIVISAVLVLTIINPSIVGGVI